MCLGEPAGADVAAGLLVADEHELQVAAGGPPASAAEGRGRDCLGRYLGLHVERAPAPQEAVHHLAGPWVVPPLGGVCQHGVDMPEQAERRAIGRALQCRDEVGALLIGGQQLGLKTGIRQVALEKLDRRAFVAGRVDRVEAHEALEDVGRLGLEARHGLSSLAPATHSAASRPAAIAAAAPAGETVGERADCEQDERDRPAGGIEPPEHAPAESDLADEVHGHAAA